MSPIEQAVILLPSRQPGPSSKGKSGAKKLLGLSLLDRVVLAVSQAGVKDFLIAGEAGRSLAKAAARLKRDRRIKDRGIRLDVLPLSRMAKGGAVGNDERPFWLISGDLVFDPEVLGLMSRSDREVHENLHLVDRGPGGGDRREGLGLKTVGPAGRAPAFVRLQDEGAAAYAGISLCAASVFPKLAAVLAERGSVDLNPESANAIFAQAESRLFETGGLFCVTVAGKDAWRSAYRYLLGTARKPTDSYISRHFNRHVSLFLTRQFLRLGIRPNPLSLGCLAVGLASGWFIGQGGYLSSAAGALLFEFASIFDGCDGEVARLTYRTSKFGGFLDMVGDATTYILFFLALPAGLFRDSRRPAWLVLGLVALLSMGVFYVQLAAFMKKAKLGNNIIGVVKDIEQSAGSPGFTSRLDGIAAKIGFIYRRDFFSTAVCVIILAGGGAVLMGVLGIFMPLEAVYLFFYSRRRLRPAQETG